MISDLLKKQATFSFEMYPPKKDDEFEKAFEVAKKLGDLKPDYISVTYGAGGSKSKKTLEIASYIQNELHIEALAHLTCVGNTRADIDAIVDAFKKEGINQVLALRGDRPRDMSDEQFEARDFAHASDLIEYLTKKKGISCAGACYPEKHFECFSKETDIHNLKIKQDAGAEYFVSQLFLDNDYYYDFIDHAERKGITVPICAGIMPVISANQLGTTVSLSGSSIPKAFSDLIAKYGDNADDMRKAGIDYAARQIQDLRANGVKHIHLYCMNRPKTTAEILEGIK
ncbi:MAG: methylenetetrahydrofolate reductase [Lachnospiraceae bacterium]|nr:methylenetetrahydrofolate reductase [NAD(P)H] [Lachnospiraceae bacterium]MBR4993849.1 methylenetetrahydrofolate reductase [NAD(P)H] [Lachnospiraceae bacterium]MBR5945032.1 methylenetetrahydrofolate reductase [NAD(P)H] [Lachnospiraceae bacterium]